MGDLAGVGGQGDQVHPVEFAAGVAPGVAGGVLDHPQEQQREPAQLDVGADAVFAVVEHRAQPERAVEVAPAALDGQELLVGSGEVVGGQRGVGGAQQPLAVQVRLALDRGLVGVGNVSGVGNSASTFRCGETASAHEFQLWPVTCPCS